MKSEKGLTLTSLIVYVIVLTMVITTITMITVNTRKSIDKDVVSVSNEEYMKFMQYLTEDLNSVDFKNLTAENNTIKIMFLDNSVHYYLYKEESIFYIEFDENVELKKEISICKDVSICNFTVENNNELKTLIRINDIVYNNNYHFESK